jgi:hypothetical protein
MTRIGQALKLAPIAGILAAGAVAIPAAAAHATPSQCVNQFWEGSGSQSGWEAKCSVQSNPDTDGWRAFANCVRPAHPTVTVYGPWIGGAGVRVGWSIAVCASGYDAASGGIQIR